MGIKNLNKFIIKYAPNAIKIIKNEELYNKKIAIDVSLIMHQYLFAIGNKLNNKITNLHIHVILIKTISLLKEKIIPIFVFDGTMPELKKNTILKRQQNNHKQHIYISKEQYIETTKILDLLGIQWIISPNEADSQCAYLSKFNLVDYVISEDMDLLAFGTKKLLRGNKNKKIEISLDIILNTIDITYEQFIDICILLGCDYSPTILGLGIVKIYKFIKVYKSIKNILLLDSFKLDNTYFNISLEFKNKYIEVYNYFKNPDIKIVDSVILKNYNKNELINILIFNYNYDKKILDRILICL